MNLTNATGSPTQTTSSWVSSSSSTLSTSFKQGVYWAVASVALIGNLVFCIALLKQRQTIFHKPYTIIVFTLAVTDITTAIFLFVSPRFVFIDTFPEPSSALGLGFYCTLIWGRSPLFYFGVVSMYLAILLTVDRWFAVVRPTQYQTSFTRKRALVGVALSALVALVVLVGSSPAMRFHPEKPVGQRCAFVRAQPARFRVTSTVSFLFKSVIPFLAIAGLYLHMFYTLKTGSQVTQQHSSAVRKRVTKVAALATLVLFVCWMPNQIAYLCFSFGKLPLISTTMDLTTILVFVSSCVNPYIYGLTVHKYRKACRDLIHSCCPCVPGARVAVDNRAGGQENRQATFHR